MVIEQRKWTKDAGWEVLQEVTFPEPPQLVFAFGGRAVIREPKRFGEIKALYPSAAIVMCSTAGEIFADEVNDNSISLAAVRFEKTTVRTTMLDISSISDSYSVGARLADELPGENLTHVCVFSDGLIVNGSSLSKGLDQGLAHDISITGGLVGDGPNFEKTLVGLNGPPAPNKVVAIGFYGTNLSVGYGSFGGWERFGPDRIITKSNGSTLIEIDGQPALSLYKDYLGDQAKNLPGSGLLFPIGIETTHSNGKPIQVVRTLLSVDEKNQTMTFAGDMPEGAVAHLMKANLEQIIDAAGTAAKMSAASYAGTQPDLAILISCVGRKLVLKDRAVEEVDAVRSALGGKVALTGFYSYGEICPFDPSEKETHLHNQTMTITTFKELA